MSREQREVIIAPGHLYGRYVKRISNARTSMKASQVLLDEASCSREAVKRG